jgi:hypothetical protein
VGDLSFLLARNGILVDIAPSDVPLPVDQQSVCGRFANFGFIVVDPRLASNPTAMRFAIAMDIPNVLFTRSDRSRISKPNRRRFARWLLLPGSVVSEFILNNTRLRSDSEAFGGAARLLAETYRLPVDEVASRVGDVWNGAPAFDTGGLAVSGDRIPNACDGMRGWMRWYVAKRVAERRLEPDGAREVLHRLEAPNPALHFTPPVVAGFVQPL